MTDTPEHYEYTEDDAMHGESAGIIIEAASLSANEDGWRLGFSGESWAETYEGADELRQEYVRAVVADSPELAQANERIAALEAERRVIRDGLDATRETMLEMVIERDAALARVAELEAVVTEMQKPDPLQEKIDALTRRVIDAAQPKPRDESVPPPGWEWDDEDDDPDEVTVDSRGVRWVLREGQQPLDKAWLSYDDEHGYAPDEARIRADERARTERDIAAHCRAGAKRNEAAADRGRHGDPFFAAVLNGSVNGMNSIAEDIERGDYAREGT